MIKISHPDKLGFASLRVSVDVTIKAVKYAEIVIVQGNPLMPRTLVLPGLIKKGMQICIPFEVFLSKLNLLFDS